MKNTFFQTALTMLFVAASLFTMTSCEKDTAETPFKENIVGVWDITSYKVGSTEYIPLLMESGSIEFNAFTGAHGVFEQLVNWPDGDFSSLSGPYTVDESRKEVSMQYEDEVIVAEIEFVNDNQIIWRSTQDAFPLVIKANRRS